MSGIFDSVNTHTMRRTLTTLILTAYTLAAIAQPSTDKTAAWYNRALKTGDLAKLTYFFSQMPKGGDLHHHYSGAVYLESYLDWIKERNMRISAISYKPVNKGTRAAITVDSLRKNNTLYRNLMSLWSTADFENHYHDEVAPDQHFFNTFGYFGPISDNYKAGLAEIKKRALQENVQYVETMLSGVKIPIPSQKHNAALYQHQQEQSTAGLDAIFDQIKNSINEAAVVKAVNTYKAQLQEARAGIDDEQFTMRYQTYTTRNNDPTTVFASLYASFRLCAAERSMVAVNFVGPENGVVAMKDYWLHMQMFRYMKALPEFSKVHVALHAGELALGMVKPEDMGYHIHDALLTAGAERIGHGVDLPYEGHAAEILRYMASHGKAIEINLVSNEFILGVKDGRHPIRMYYDAHVPMVIATDDAGVSRSSLTEQYVLLASRYGFSYREIKELVFNSIEYSFMSHAMKCSHKAVLRERFAAFEHDMAYMP